MIGDLGAEGLDTMRPDSWRWVEVSRSQYAHERHGIEHIRAHLPDEEPYRGWSNCDIITGDRQLSLDGDVLALGPAGLFLIELKAWEGRITGDAYTWSRHIGGRKTAVNVKNPWLLVNNKARQLKSILQFAAAARARRRGTSTGRIPWVQGAVFLHNPEVRWEIAAQDRTFVFGLDGEEEATHLSGIVTGLLSQPAKNPARAITAEMAVELSALLEEAGIGRPVRQIVASYVLGEVLTQGPGWRDYLATHERFADDQARVRLYFTTWALTCEQKVRLERAAQREYRLARRLSHAGIIAPKQFQDTELGPALVYPHDEGAQRLSALLAGSSEPLPLRTLLGIVRGLAESIRHAHDRGVTHRGLSPDSVLVTLDGDGAGVKVTDWQTAAREVGEGLAAESVLEGTADASVLVGSDTRFYQAPEIGRVYRPDHVRADVFSLGAIAYAVFGGELPDPGEFVSHRARLISDGGLRMSPSGGVIPVAAVDLVYDATRADRGQRIADLDTFIAHLAEVEDTVRNPGTPRSVAAPAGAGRGLVFAGRWRLVRELGSGSTSQALLVEDMANDDARRVLKVARSPDHQSSLLAEAKTLAALDHAGIVRLVMGSIDIDGRAALITEQAGVMTLAALLRRQGPLSTDRLKQFGDDLLKAVIYLTDLGICHRDIKPANLGVFDRRSGPRLILFDFSHSNLPMASIEAGTPPYRDPFLGATGRFHWNFAAECYATAVTLFEMASGEHPRYGDGRSDPRAVRAEATVEPMMFRPLADPERDAAAEFFKRALRRDVELRFPDIAAMSAAWSSIFGTQSRAMPFSALAASGKVIPREERLVTAVFAPAAERPGEKPTGGPTPADRAVTGRDRQDTEPPAPAAPASTSQQPSETIRGGQPETVSPPPKPVPNSRAVGRPTRRSVLATLATGSAAAMAGAAWEITRLGGASSRAADHSGGPRPTRSVAPPQPGTKIWTADVGGIAGPSPTVMGDTVYIGVNTRVDAFHARSGRRIWGRHVGGTAGPPIVGSGLVYVCCDNGKIYALEAFDGARGWSYPYGSIVGTQATLSYGVLYAGNSDGQVMALLADDGRRMWSYPTGNGAIDAPPAVTHGVVCVLNFFKNLFAFDISRGTPLWSYTTGSLDSGPVAADGVFYLGGDDENLHAFRAEDGHEIWRHHTGPLSYGGIASVGSAVYAVSDHGQVSALSVSDGSVIWSHFVGDGRFFWLTVSANRVYVADQRTLYALDVGHGTRLWSQPAEDMASAPTATAAAVYIGNQNGEITAFHA